MEISSLVLALIVAPLTLLTAPLTVAASLAAQATPPELAPVVELVDAAVRLAAIVLPLIGITGGIKGLLPNLPTIPLGPWRVKPGLYVSWILALPLTALAYMNGWLPALATFASVEAAVVAYWGILAATANVVRNAMVGRGGTGTGANPGTEPGAAAGATRTAARSAKPRAGGAA